MKTTKHLTPLQAIRAKCLDCSQYQPKEVRLCTIADDCAIYPFRFGKSPYRKGIGRVKNIGSSKAKVKVPVNELPQKLPTQSAISSTRS